MKYVLVTGGVVSGLGKGVTASSIGVLLKSCGFRVTSIKIGKPAAAAAAAARARGASVSDFNPLRSNRKKEESNGGHVIAQAANTRPPRTKQKPLQPFSGLPPLSPSPSHA